jgi:hypothetical protein
VVFLAFVGFFDSVDVLAAEYYAPAAACFWNSSSSAAQEARCPFARNERVGQDHLPRRRRPS